MHGLNFTCVNVPASWFPTKRLMSRGSTWERPFFNQQVQSELSSLACEDQYQPIVHRKKTHETKNDKKRENLLWNTWYMDFCFHCILFAEIEVRLRLKVYDQGDRYYIFYRLKTIRWSHIIFSSRIFTIRFKPFNLRL